MVYSIHVFSKGLGEDQGEKTHRKWPSPPSLRSHFKETKHLGQFIQRLVCHLSFTHFSIQPVIRSVTVCDSPATVHEWMPSSSKLINNLLCLIWSMSHCILMGSTHYENCLVCEYYVQCTESAEFKIRDAQYTGSILDIDR